MFAVAGNLAPSSLLPTCSVLPAWTPGSTASPAAIPRPGAISVDSIHGANKCAPQVPLCYHCGRLVPVAARHRKHYLVLPSWTGPKRLARPCALSGDVARAGQESGAMDSLCYQRGLPPCTYSTRLTACPRVARGRWGVTPAGICVDITPVCTAHGRFVLPAWTHPLVLTAWTSCATSMDNLCD